jgi:hypothetical protein
VSVAQQLLESLAGGGLPGIAGGGRNIIAATELEVFAVIAEVLFRDRLGAPIPALIGGTRIITNTVEAHPEIRSATQAALTSAGLTG